MVLVWLRVAAVLAVCTGPAAMQTAQAQEAPDAELNNEEARALFRAGRAAFSAGRYEEAYQYFQRAYDLHPRDELLFNVALAAERAERFDLALRTYEKFVETVPNSAQTPAARASIASLRERTPAAAPVFAPATVPPQNPGATPVAPQEPQAPSPSPAPMVTPPGASPAPVAPAASTSAPAAEAAATTSSAPAPSDRGGPGIAPTLTLIAGGVLLLGGIIMAVVGLTDVKTAEEPDSDDWSDVSDAAERGPALFAAGITFSVIGGVAALAGLVWKLVAGRSSSVSLGLQGAELRGTF